MTTVNSVIQGNVRRVSVVFTTTSGLAADPTTVTCKYEDPSGNTTTKVYISDAEVVKTATGAYYLDIDCDEAGTWYYRWIGTGAVQAAAQGRFYVEPAKPI